MGCVNVFVKERESNRGGEREEREEKSFKKESEFTGRLKHLSFFYIIMQNPNFTHDSQQCNVDLISSSL